MTKKLSIGDLVTRFHQIKRGERKGDLVKAGQAIIDEAVRLNVPHDVMRSYMLQYTPTDPWTDMILRNHPAYRGARK
jgi:hypothetical protein